MDIIKNLESFNENELRHIAGIMNIQVNTNESNDNIIKKLVHPIMTDYVYELLKNGVVVIPFLDTQQLKDIRISFISTVFQFPEYISTTHPVLGGFAAFGNPSSFHNPFIRKLRKDVYKYLQKVLFKDYASVVNPSLKSEMLFDRMLLRKKGQNPLAESWHRDVCSKPPKSTLSKGDNILGGWLNLDDNNQFFSCVPGTHLDVELYDLTDGFDRFTKEQSKQLDQRKQKITVKPGHLVLFYQHIAHEVLPNKAKNDMYRLFHGFRLTTSDKQLFESDYKKRKVFEDQAIPRLPSYQLPTMYSKNHQTFFTGLTKKKGEIIGKFKLSGQTKKTNLIWWSKDTFKESILEEYERKWDKSKYLKVAREMKSLRQYNLPLYTPYTDNEIILYTPQKIL